MALDALNSRGEIQMVDRAREVVPCDEHERVRGNEKGVGVVVSALELPRGEFGEGATPAICAPGSEAGRCTCTKLLTEVEIGAVVGANDGDSEQEGALLNLGPSGRIRERDTLR